MPPLQPLLPEIQRCHASDDGIATVCGVIVSAALTPPAQEKLPDRVFHWPVRQLRLLQRHPAPRHQQQSAPQTSCVGMKDASGGQPAFGEILLRLFQGVS